MADGLRVTFAELGVRDGTSPTLSADLETACASRTLIIDGTDTQKAMAELLGYSELNTDGSLVRYLPQEDWRFDGLWATKVTRVNGISWIDKYEREFGSVNKFEKAALSVDFMPRPYSVLPKSGITTEGDEDTEATTNEFLRYVEVETTIEGDYLTVPVTGLLYWNEGPDTLPNGQAFKFQPFPGNLGKIVCSENYVFRWHQIPDIGIPEARILDAIGHVNKTDFGDPGTTRLFFDAGTLLLLGAGWRRIFMWTPTGVKPAWTIEYTMKFVPQGHNQLLAYQTVPMDFYQISRGDGASPPTITHYAPGSVPDGQCIYDEAEFGGLFDTTP